MFFILLKINDFTVWFVMEKGKRASSDEGGFEQGYTMTKHLTTHFTPYPTEAALQIMVIPSLFSK